MPDQRPSRPAIPQPRWKRVSPELACALAVNLDDECYYLLVRTPGGWRASPANALVADFKMPPGEYQQSLRMWRRKQDAVRTLAGAVADLLGSEPFRSRAYDPATAPIALVPLPTHLPKAHPLHDERLARLCALAAAGSPHVHPVDAFDARAETAASHSGGARGIAPLMDGFSLGPLDTPEGPPRLAVLVDDVLTTGAHFAACRDLVRRQDPDLPVVGVFLAMHQSDKVDYPVPLEPDPRVPAGAAPLPYRQSGSSPMSPTSCANIIPPSDRAPVRMTAGAGRERCAHAVPTSGHAPARAAANFTGYAHATPSRGRAATNASTAIASMGGTEKGTEPQTLPPCGASESGEPGKAPEHAAAPTGLARLLEADPKHWQGDFRDRLYRPPNMGSLWTSNPSPAPPTWAAGTSTAADAPPSPAERLAYRLACSPAARGVARLAQFALAAFASAQLLFGSGDAGQIAAVLASPVFCFVMAAAGEVSFPDALAPPWAVPAVLLTLTASEFELAFGPATHALSAKVRSSIESRRR